MAACVPALSALSWSVLTIIAATTVYSRVGGGPGLLDLLPLVDWGPGAPCSEVVTGAGLQDRKIAHCPFHMLMPAERETFLARKKLLEYMGLQLRQAVFAKECQWDPKVLHLSTRGGCGGCSGRVGAWAWWAAAQRIGHD